MLMLHNTNIEDSHDRLSENIYISTIYIFVYDKYIPLHTH